MTAIIKNHKINTNTYGFTVSFRGRTFTHTVSVDDYGRWRVPSFVPTAHKPLVQNIARQASVEFTQFLQKNPLFTMTNRIDGKTNKRIVEKNRLFA